MGIRFNVSVGYGFSDLDGMKKGLDLRLVRHPRDVNKDDDENGLRQPFMDWLQAKLDDKDAPVGGFGLTKADVVLTKIMLDNDKNWQTWESIIWEEEGGDPGVLMFIPPGMGQDWHRRDNVIDYVDRTRMEHQNLDAEVTTLTNGIPFYNKIWWDIRDGRKLPNFQDKTPFSPLQIANGELGKDMMLEITGMKTALEFNRFARPMVPPPIQLMCEFLGIFQDPRTMLDMRPMIYKWWA